MRLGFFQPDIPQNLGAAQRLCAGLGVPLDVILPCAFPLSDKSMKRAALDYGPEAEVKLHDDWQDFLDASRKNKRRIVLLTTKAKHSFHTFAFQPDDVLLLGRESAGAPDYVHDAADARIIIPMTPSIRSFNVVTAGAMILSEGLRQLGHYDARCLANANMD